MGTLDIDEDQMLQETGTLPEGGLPAGLGPEQRPPTPKEQAEDRPAHSYDNILDKPREVDPSRPPGHPASRTVNGSWRETCGVSLTVLQQTRGEQGFPFPPGPGGRQAEQVPLAGTTPPRPHSSTPTGMTNA